MRIRELLGAGLMLSRRTVVCVALALLAVTPCLSCCTASTYGKSAFGTEGGYSLDNAKPKIAHLMVARKIDRPLYIILDPERVKDTWPLETAACATGRPGCERFKLMQVQTFVRRDKEMSGVSI